MLFPETIDPSSNRNLPNVIDIGCQLKLETLLATYGFALRNFHLVIDISQLIHSQLLNDCSPDFGFRLQVLTVHLVFVFLFKFKLSNMISLDLSDFNIFRNFPYSTLDCISYDVTVNNLTKSPPDIVITISK